MLCRVVRERLLTTPRGFADFGMLVLSPPAEESASTLRLASCKRLLLRGCTEESTRGAEAVSGTGIGVCTPALRSHLVVVWCKSCSVCEPWKSWTDELDQERYVVFLEQAQPRRIPLSRLVAPPTARWSVRPLYCLHGRGLDLMQQKTGRSRRLVIPQDRRPDTPLGEAHTVDPKRGHHLPQLVMEMRFDSVPHPPSPVDECYRRRVEMKTMRLVRLDMARIMAYEVLR